MMRDESARVFSTALFDLRSAIVTISRADKRRYKHSVSQCTRNKVLLRGSKPTFRVTRPYFVTGTCDYSDGMNLKANLYS